MVRKAWTFWNYTLKLKLLADVNIQIIFIWGIIYILLLARLGNQNMYLKYLNVSPMSCDLKLICWQVPGICSSLPFPHKAVTKPAFSWRNKTVDYCFWWEVSHLIVWYSLSHIPCLILPRITLFIGTVFVCETFFFTVHSHCPLCAASCRQPRRLFWQAVVYVNSSVNHC